MGIVGKLRNWLNHEEIYQIFVVRAKKSGLSRFLYVIIFIAFSIGYPSLIGLANKPLSFEELKVERGILEDCVERGSRHRGKIIIYDINGDRKIFERGLTHDQFFELKKLKGKEISVYYRVEIQPFLLSKKMAKSIVYNDKNIVNYNIDWHNKSYLISWTIFLICFFVSCFFLFNIFLINRKKSQGGCE